MAKDAVEPVVKTAVAGAGDTQAASGVVEDQPAFDRVDTPIDPLILRQCMLLARSRRRSPEHKKFSEGRLAAVWRNGDIGFAVVQQADPETPRLEALEAKVRFGPNVARLLLAIHARIITAESLEIRLEERWLANVLWGVVGGWPGNWRREVAQALDAASVLWFLHVDSEGKVQAANLLANVTTVGGGLVLRGSPALLGSLNVLADEDGKLEIVAKRANPQARVTNKDIAKLIAQDPKHYGNQQNFKRDDLKRIIQKLRMEDAQKPSLQTIGRQGGLFPLFLPGVLGDPVACREAGAMAVLLYREQTRAKPIENALVPGWSGPAKVVCPLLDINTSYVAFAANSGKSGGEGWKKNTTRQGRGYKLATWAEKLSNIVGQISVDDFLDSLALAAAKLELVAAALDSDGTWHNLDQLQAAPPDLRDRVNLRIYTRHDDYITRWCQFFGWTSEVTGIGAGGEPGSTPAPEDELTILASNIREQGIREVARSTGIDQSNLSKILKGKRKPRADVLVRLREHLWGSQELGGRGPGTIFGECSSMLDYALAYRRLGWAVVPMAPTTSAQKKPCVKTKPFFTMLPTESQIRQWWGQWPEAGIALVLGPQSGVVVIDVDGQAAHDVLVQHLEGEPKAPKAMSGSGDPFRMHFFFRHPPPPFKTQAKATPWHNQLEFRGHKGLVVLAPSPHHSGNQYQWVKNQSVEDLALPELPQEVLETLQASTGRIPRPPVTPRGNQGGGTMTVAGLNVSQATADFLNGKYASAVGERNDRLFNAACELKARGMPLGVAQPLLLAGLTIENQAHHDESVTTIASAYSTERNLGGPSQPTASPRRPPPRPRRPEQR